MSKKNIVDVSISKRTVTFKTDEGDRTYQYSRQAIKKILDGRDPSQFKAEEVK